MASFQCAHCSRPVFLRHQQLAPVSGLCVPCNHKAAEQRRADQAWRRFRDKLLAPVETLKPSPLLPPADLRHL